MGVLNMKLSDVKETFYRNGFRDASAEGFWLGDLFDEGPDGPIMKAFGLLRRDDSEEGEIDTFPDGVEIDGLEMFGFPGEYSDDNRERFFDLFHFFGNKETDRWLGVLIPMDLDADPLFDELVFFRTLEELDAFLKTAPKTLEIDED
jgi:hypothetical protein